MSVSEFTQGALQAAAETHAMTVEEKRETKVEVLKREDNGLRRNLL